MPASLMRAVGRHRDAVPVASKIRTPTSVLRYGLPRPAQSTVYRHYVAWRLTQTPPLPVRCDNTECKYHTRPLVWNGKPFRPILDHVEGVRADNRPEKLRFLCPMCDSQLATRGGGNKGRVEMSSGGYAIKAGGRKDYFLPVETGQYVLAPGVPPRIE